MRKRAISLTLVFIFVINTVYFARAAIEQNNELEYQWNLAVHSSKSTDEATYSEYKQPSSNIQSDDPDIVSLAHSIVKDISDDYEKARAIYNWVSGNTWYDWDCLEDITKRGENSALETLQTRRGVCVGYSNLTVAMLRAIGIPALVAAGYATHISGALGSSSNYQNRSATLTTYGMKRILMADGSSWMSPGQVIMHTDMILTIENNLPIRHISIYRSMIYQSPTDIHLITTTTIASHIR